jgi:hypothetical protein
VACTPFGWADVDRVRSVTLGRTCALPFSLKHDDYAQILTDTDDVVDSCARVVAHASKGG